MECEKLMVEGKEFEVEIETGNKLSENELEKVSGGLLTPVCSEEITLYTMVCKICGWRSETVAGSVGGYNALKGLVVPHLRDTTHSQYLCEESSGY